MTTLFTLKPVVYDDYKGEKYGSITTFQVLRNGQVMATCKKQEDAKAIIAALYLALPIFHLRDCNGAPCECGADPNRFRLVP